MDCLVGRTRHDALKVVWSVREAGYLCAAKSRSESLVCIAMVA